jgi:elongation factor P hydroxylase
MREEIDEEVTPIELVAATEEGCGKRRRRRPGPRSKFWECPDEPDQRSQVDWEKLERDRLIWENASQLGFKYEGRLDHLLWDAETKSIMTHLNNQREIRREFESGRGLEIRFESES